MLLAALDADIMAIHAVNALSSLGEDELFDSLLTNLTIEAMRVVGIVACHDGFVQYRQATNIAVVRAVGAHR